MITHLVRAPLIAATAAVLALTATGCGGSDADPGAGAADSTRSTASVGPTTGAADTDPQGSSTPSATARPPGSSDGEADDNSDAEQGDGSNGDAPTNAPAGGGTGGTTAATDTVRLTLKVTGCATCTFTAFTTDRGTTRPLGARTVSGGVATWTLDRAQTSGLAFTVTTPQGEGVSNAQAAMVWQYSGITVGSRITDAQAARSDRGTWCWSGTSSPRVTVPVTVVRFNEKGSGSRASSLRVYANPMASGQAPFVETSRGALGVQDEPFCPG